MPTRFVTVLKVYSRSSSLLRTKDFSSGKVCVFRVKILRYVFTNGNKKKFQKVSHDVQKDALFGSFGLETPKTHRNSKIFTVTRARYRNCPKS